VHRFVDWLSQTPLSLAIQTQEWVIPAVQSIHIIAIGGVMGSVLMMALQVWGWAGRDQTLVQMVERFAPWFKASLLVLLLTGAVMIIGEPARELLALSFWLKMLLVASGSALVVSMQRSAAHHDAQAPLGVERAAGMKTRALIVLLIWVVVIVLGRLIAYDYVWGSWSQSLKG
jgi:hypothetical protein